MRNMRMFFRSLSSSQRDNAQFAVQDMIGGNAWSKLDDVERQLKEISVEIDHINKRREVLRAEKDRLHNLLAAISRFESQHSLDTEMYLVKSVLSSRLDFLSQVIGETRPDEELRKKHLLVREKQLLEDCQKVGNEMVKVLGDVSR